MFNNRLKSNNKKAKENKIGYHEYIKENSKEIGLLH